MITFYHKEIILCPLVVCPKNTLPTHLRLALFVSHYPHLLKIGINLYFCYFFTCLISKYLKKKLKIKKSREKKIQKLSFIKIKTSLLNLFSCIKF